MVTDQSDFDFGDDESNEEPEKLQVKVALVEEEPKIIVEDVPSPTPIMAHGKILDDYGNVIGTF